MENVIIGVLLLLFLYKLDKTYGQRHDQDDIDKPGPNNDFKK